MIMEKTTNELILEKLLVIESNQGNLQTEMNEKFKELKDEISDLKDEVLVNRETINYVGSKVFDNHEVRIKTLENHKNI